MPAEEKPRIVEAYIGEYASGKSEVAVNRAVGLAKKGKRVTLADLDLVEPCYTLRPLKKELGAQGVTVLAWETGELIGLGEIGNLLYPEVRFCLRRTGDIVLDVGYGASGAEALHLVEGSEKDPDLLVIVVVNTARPLTGSRELIVEYVAGLGLDAGRAAEDPPPAPDRDRRKGAGGRPADRPAEAGALPGRFRIGGLINNTNLGEETTVELVNQGALVVAGAAGELGFPYLGSRVTESLLPAAGEYDAAGGEVRGLHLYLRSAFW